MKLVFSFELLVHTLLQAFDHRTRPPSQFPAKQTRVKKKRQGETRSRIPTEIFLRSLDEANHTIAIRLSLNGMFHGRKVSVESFHVMPGLVLMDHGSRSLTIIMSCGWLSYWLTIYPAITNTSRDATSLYAQQIHRRTGQSNDYTSSCVDSSDRAAFRSMIDCSRPGFSISTTKYAVDMYVDFREAREEKRQLNFSLSESTHIVVHIDNFSTSKEIPRFSLSYWQLGCHRTKGSIRCRDSVEGI
jgi:hypothetical protein